MSTLYSCDLAFNCSPFPIFGGLVHRLCDSLNSVIGEYVPLLPHFSTTMFSLDFYLLCFAVAGYVILVRGQTGIDTPARRRRPRPGVPQPPAGRGGEAPPAAVVPRRRNVRSSVAPVADHVEMTHINQ